MSDNLQASRDPAPARANGEFFALPGFRVLALTGPDAATFAQAQTMNEVAALAPGHWQWNGWLTPKGRLIALFALIRLDRDTLWWLLPDADPETIATQLRRFVFRSKVEIAARPDLHVSASFSPPADADGSAITGASDDIVELDLGGADGARTLRIGPAGNPIDTNIGDDADAVARWFMFDLAHGLPRLQPSQVERWTPQQLSLQRLHAYSVHKGCYPGQEIVARTHFLGKAKRELVRLELDGPVAIDAEVLADGTSTGVVVVVPPMLDSSPTQVLAVLSEGATERSLRIGDLPASMLPLLDGLAR